MVRKSAMDKKYKNGRKRKNTKEKDEKCEKRCSEAPKGRKTG